MHTASEETPNRIFFFPPPPPFSLFRLLSDKSIVGILTHSQNLVSDFLAVGLESVGQLTTSLFYQKPIVQYRQELMLRLFAKNNSWVAKSAPFELLNSFVFHSLATREISVGKYKAPLAKTKESNFILYRIY